DGDLGRRGDVARADRRRHAGRHREERGERLHRALELRPRRDLRRDRRVHARRAGAGDGAALARGDGGAPAARGAGRAGPGWRRTLSALAVRNLDKSFGGLCVTAAVSLSVEPGERRLIIGPNGAGKTTLFNLITGELLPDEPFAGLSIEERRDVRRLVTGIPRDVTIVMIEHDMDVALDFAERITVLHFGEVVVEGTRAEVVAHPRTKEIYLGE